MLHILESSETNARLSISGFKLVTQPWASSFSSHAHRPATHPVPEAYQGEREIKLCCLTSKYGPEYGQSHRYAEYTWTEGIFCCLWVECSIKFIRLSSVMFLKSPISLLVIDLFVVSVAGRGVFRSLSIIVDLSIFSSFSFWFMYSELSVGRWTCI